MTQERRFSPVDLFSGAGGMRFCFHRHHGFRLIAAADGEEGEPGSGARRPPLRGHDAWSRDMADAGSRNNRSLRRTRTVRMRNGSRR